MTGYEIKEFTREETDGSKTYTYAMECNGIMKTHNNKGPAILNKEQKIKEYYLYGVKMTKDKWEVKRKHS
tara:strand:- start:497 stop:706 length:210 start_codon:yes stop_codon:yes gene_type:complete